MNKHVFSRIPIDIFPKNPPFFGLASRRSVNPPRKDPAFFRGTSPLFCKEFLGVAGEKRANGATGRTK